MMTAEPWSARMIIDRLGADEALARELVALFLTEYPRMIGSVRDSIATGSADSVRRAAHALKGSVANFTDGGPMRAALALEMMAREGELAGVPAAFQALEREMQAFVAQLEDFIRS